MENTVENKPKTETSWLKELGEQSWQAEFILSSLVITILFQLPEMFMEWIGKEIISTSEIEYTFFNMASLYFFMGLYSLILFLGIHLLFRSIWIALLGLDSVYPNGINEKSEYGNGTEYWQKTKKEFPDLSAYCQKLDENCSTIFSIAALIFINVCSISVFIMLIYYILTSLISIFPAIESNITFIAIGIYLVFMLITIIVRYLGKKYPANDRIKTFSDIFSKIMSYIFSLYFFRTAVSYITSIFSSNIHSKYFGAFTAIISVFFGYYGATQLFSRPAIYNFDKKEYYTFNSDSSQILNINYENLIDKNEIIYTPIIQSDVITDHFLKVFIPHIVREEKAMQQNYISFFDKFKYNKAEREAIRMQNKISEKQFNRIFLNNIEYKNLDFQFYQHPQAIEKGLLVYIPTDSLKVGKNILEIRKNMYSEDSIQKIVKIPFFFDKNEDK